MQGKPKPVRAHEREVGKGEKMKSIMISIQPKWCAKIESGAKTIEVRKTRPKIETPFKCYIYCTFPQKPVYDIWINRGTENRFLGNGKVIGEFVCDRIDEIDGYPDCNIVVQPDELVKMACLTQKQAFKYIRYGTGYAWYITDLKIYDKPKELGENGDFKFPCVRGGEDFYTHRKCMGCKYACRWAGTMEIYCDRWVTRPPQSWCYVEDLED